MKSPFLYVLAIYTVVLQIKKRKKEAIYVLIPFLFFISGFNDTHRTQRNKLKRKTWSSDISMAIQKARDRYYVVFFTACTTRVFNWVKWINDLYCTIVELK